MVKVTFETKDGTSIDSDVEEGMSVLDAARQCGADLEGACEGSLACSTCHVYVDEAWFDRLDPPDDDEEDMLDLAFELRPTSRLGCQIKLTSALDGLKVQLPSTGDSS